MFKDRILPSLLLVFISMFLFFCPGQAFSAPVLTWITADTDAYVECTGGNTTYYYSHGPGSQSSANANPSVPNTIFPEVDLNAGTFKVRAESRSDGFEEKANAGLHLLSIQNIGNQAAHIPAGAITLHGDGIFSYTIGDQQGGATSQMAMQLTGVIGSGSLTGPHQAFSACFFGLFFTF